MIEKVVARELRATFGKVLDGVTTGVLELLRKQDKK
jgi:hypothetical protein